MQEVRFMNKRIKGLVSVFLLITLLMGIVGCAEAPVVQTPVIDPSTQPSVETTLPDPSQETTDGTVPTEPEVTEPEVTEPEVTEPEVTEPQTGNHTHNYTAKENAAEYYIEYTCSGCGASYREYNFPSTGDTAFFDDAAFIGDSVTLKLKNYHLKTGILGGTTFLCAGSYSMAHALGDTLQRDRVWISYQGQNMYPEDALKACGAKKVFILLGMNDIALYGIDDTLERWDRLVSRIREKNPDIQIYIQSGTPIYTAGQIGYLNNNQVDKYNARLVTFAQESGCVYIDIATPMKDSSNGLKEEYCSDAYVHFTDAACKLWVDILKNAVA